MIMMKNSSRSDSFRKINFRSSRFTVSHGRILFIIVINQDHTTIGKNHKRSCYDRSYLFRLCIVKQLSERYSSNAVHGRYTQQKMVGKTGPFFVRISHKDGNPYGKLTG